MWQNFKRPHKHLSNLELSPKRRSPVQVFRPYQHCWCRYQTPLIWSYLPGPISLVKGATCLIGQTFHPSRPAQHEHMGGCLHATTPPSDDEQRHPYPGEEANLSWAGVSWWRASLPGLGPTCIIFYAPAQIYTAYFGVSRTNTDPIITFSVCCSLIGFMKNLLGLCFLIPKINIVLGLLFINYSH